MNFTPQFCGVLLYGLQNNYRPIRDQAYWSKSEGSLQWHKTANYKNALYKTKKRPTHCKPLSWCHQEMSFISKWLYIFALKNRDERNLPLLLHLNSAPFCSVSQSLVPTLMQRYIIIVIYKWELQSYFFIISSIRHFIASSKPFLIPCDNP